MNKRTQKIFVWTMVIIMILGVVGTFVGIFLSGK